MRSRNGVLGAMILALSALLLPRETLADTCPAPEGASESVTRIDPEERLAYVSRATRTAGEKSAQWGSFWRLTFQVAAGTQFGLAKATTDEATRIDLTSGAIKSSVGLVFGYVFQLPAERHHNAFHGEPLHDERPLCVRLAEEETKLAADAKGERRGRSIVMHALGFSLNLGVGIVTGLKSERWSTAILGMVIGSLVGTTRILTQPTVATEAWDAYKDGRVTKTAQITLSPWVAPIASGFELGIGAAF